MAQEGPPETKASEPTITMVAQWVRQSGKPSVLDGYIAKALGLGAADFHTIQKAFANKSIDRTYGFDVLPSRPDFLLWRKDNGFAVGWLVSGDGIVARTATQENEHATPVPNDRYLELWRETRGFFFERMKKDLEKAK